MRASDRNTRYPTAAVASDRAHPPTPHAICLTARGRSSHDRRVACGERVPVPARLALVLGLIALCTLHKLHNVPVWDDVQNLERAAELRAQGEPWRVFAN